MLPEPIADNIKDQFETDISDFKAVYGGDINQSGQITLNNGSRYFIKWNLQSDPAMFSKEAKGLDVLSGAKSGLKIPEVHSYSDSFLIMEWLEKKSNGHNSSYDFGCSLALMHRNTSDYFGLDHNNFIGKLPQSNNVHTNWPDFYALERIEPQVQMAVENGKIDRSLFRTVQKLYTKLGRIFPQEEPALLHGDLWSGNYMYLEEGQTAIYDPAVYYGHREMDISMTRLFGGFSETFYKGYEDEYPLEKGYEDRIKLCNLYPILVHANLFGGSYCRQAEQIINHYA